MCRRGLRELWAPASYDSETAARALHPKLHWERRRHLIAWEGATPPNALILRCSKLPHSFFKHLETLRTFDITAPASIPKASQQYIEPPAPLMPPQQCRPHH